MAFFISPGVQVREFDISTVVTQNANSAAAYVGSFEWGPVEEITTISSKARLQKYFGNPTDENALHWFSCSNFLDYANNLKVIRVVNEDIARNATVLGGEAEAALNEIKNSAQFSELTDEITNIIRSIPRLENQKKTLESNKDIYTALAASTSAASSDLETAKNTALQDYEDANLALTNANTAKDNLVTQISNTERDLNTARQELEGLQIERAQLDPNATNYEDLKANVDGRISTKETEIENTEATLKSQKSSLDAKNRDIQAAKLDVVEKDRIYKKALAAYESNQAIIENANAQVTNLTVSIAETEQAILDAKASLGTKESQLENLNKQLETAEANVKNATTFIRNQSHWSKQFSPGNDHKFGEFAAKFPSALGSNIAVYMADANTYSGVSKVETNVTSYVWTAADDSMEITFTAPPTGYKDIASGFMVLDLDNPQVDKNGVERYTIKEFVITNPGKNYRVAPDVTLPAPTNPIDENNVMEGVPKAYASLWKYANQFLNPPNTSNYVRQRGGENDELHIVVVDETGVLTGTKGQVMERFANVSKAEDARFDDSTQAYYVYVLRDQSQYVFWMDHPEGMTDWGQQARNTSFKMLETAYVGRLGGGVSGSARENITNSELIRGWDYFSDPERVDVGILITGPADRILQQYVINIAERRMDCVAVISPEQECVVECPGMELKNMLSWRDVLNASSYGFADCNWKYQYDQYNDTYRWLPCNPDIAGLMARTDEDHDPWWSPAGFNRGHIKNVVKLAWNPDKTDRDEMYGVSINPVCLFLNEGTILYGDKTMLLKTSAFSRINVRRLFIVLEKSIATAAKYMLFEFNDDFTRIRFRQMVEPFLRDVKGKRGMYDYRVVCDASNNTPQVIDSNAFVGDIYIKPTRSINFVQLNFVAVATGVAFEEVIGSFGDF